MRAMATCPFHDLEEGGKLRVAGDVFEVGEERFERLAGLGIAVACAQQEKPKARRGKAGK